MKGARILAILVLALGLMVLPVQAAPVGMAFNYQGRLIDANDTADGEYDFQFELYDSPADGNQLGSTIDVNELELIDGYFTVLLDFNEPNAFNGEARWLEIGVRPGDLNDPNVYTVLEPRQEVTATPYALYATSGPSVPVPLELSGSVASPGAIISGTNTGSGHGIYGEATVSGADGVYGSHSGGTWGYIGGSVRGVFGKNTNNGNMGWLAGPDEGVRGDSLGGYGVYGSSINRAIYGLAFNNYGYNGYSGYFENGNFYIGGGSVGIGTTTPAYKLDVSGDIRATGVIHGTIAGSIANADKVDNYHAGNSSGQVAVSNSTLCTNLNADKLDGQHSSYYRNWNNLTNVPSGFADGIDNVGGGGLTLPYSGSTSSGIAFWVTHTGNGTALKGTSAGGYGVTGENTGSGNHGGLGGSNHAVYASSEEGFGVYSTVTDIQGIAVYGYATNSGDGTNYGGYFWARGSEGRGIYAKGGRDGYAAEFQGNVIIKSQSTGTTVVELGEGLDYAEGFDVSDKKQIAAGSVLIIDEKNPGKLAISDKPYDRKVAGIVAGAKGLGSGVRLGADQFDCDVALAGRVHCNVDATETAVEPGDLLTTSAMPGYAMKVADYMRAQGAILGKSMESLEKGTKGQILVLVTLQ